jgi:hypothetical protein
MLDRLGIPDLRACDFYFLLVNEIPDNMCKLLDGVFDQGQAPIHVSVS